MSFAKLDSSTSQQVTAQQKTKILTYSFTSPPSLIDLNEMVIDAMGEFSNTPLTLCSDPGGGALKIMVQAIEEALP